MATPTATRYSTTKSVTFNWPVDAIFLRSYITECLDSKQEPIKSTTFDAGFYLELHPKDGSLYLLIEPGSELEHEEVNAQVNVSVLGTSAPFDKSFEASYEETRLGVTNWFDFTNLLDDSTESLDIFCEITYTANTATHITPTYHLQCLSRDFEAFRKKSILTDVVLQCGRGEFKAHKIILAARSSVFAAMFNHEEVTENQDQQVDITDIDEDVMEAFLSYIYTGNTASVEKYSTELLVAADKYDIQPLVRICIQSMLKNIDIESAANIFYLVDLYQLNEAKSQVMDFVVPNIKKIMKTKTWYEFVRPKHHLVEELLTILADKLHYS